MKRPSLLACIAPLLFVLVASAGPALAEAGDRPDTRVLDDKWGVSLGGYAVDFQTTAAVGTGTFIGTVIRLEDDLSVDSNKTTFRLGGFYRFKKRHGIEIGFFDLNRSGSTIIDEQIEFQGVVYDVGAEINSTFDAQLFKATYRYSFINSGKTEAGFSAGLSTYWFDIALDGEATVEENRQVYEEVRTETDLLAPVPSLGMFITHAITPKLLLHLRAQFFDLSVGDYSGRLIDTSFSFDYYFTRHFGIGLGGNTNDIRYENMGDKPYTVDYSQSGLIWYLTGVF